MQLSNYAGPSSLPDVKDEADCKYGSLLGLESSIQGPRWALQNQPALTWKKYNSIEMVVMVTTAEVSGGLTRCRPG